VTEEATQHDIGSGATLAEARVQGHMAEYEA